MFYEITDEPFFRGENLVNREFADVQTEVAKFGLPVRGLGEAAS